MPNDLLSDKKKILAQEAVKRAMVKKVLAQKALAMKSMMAKPDYVSMPEDQLKAAAQARSTATAPATAPVETPDRMGLPERFGKQLANAPLTAISQVRENWTTPTATSFPTSLDDPRVMTKEQSDVIVNEQRRAGSILGGSRPLISEKNDLRFEIPKAENLKERLTDVAAGLTAFMAAFAAFKKVPLGKADGALRSLAAWEGATQATGGKPGEGTAMAFTIGGINKIPLKGVVGGAAKTAATSATFAGMTAAEGGDAVDTLIAALIPVTFKGYEALRKKYSAAYRAAKPGEHEQVLKEAQFAVADHAEAQAFLKNSDVATLQKLRQRFSDPKNNVHVKLAAAIDGELIARGAAVASKDQSVPTAEELAKRQPVGEDRQLPAPEIDPYQVAGGGKPPGKLQQERLAIKDAEKQLKLNQQLAKKAEKETTKKEKAAKDAEEEQKLLEEMSGLPVAEKKSAVIEPDLSRVDFDATDPKIFQRTWFAGRKPGVEGPQTGTPWTTSDNRIAEAYGTTATKQRGTLESYKLKPGAKVLTRKNRIDLFQEYFDISDTEREEIGFSAAMGGPEPAYEHLATLMGVSTEGSFLDVVKRVDTALINKARERGYDAIHFTEGDDPYDTLTAGEELVFVNPDFIEHKTVEPDLSQIDFDATDPQVQRMRELEAQVKTNKSDFLAVMTSDGKVHIDPLARMHGDVVSNLGLDATDIIDGGFVTNGKYIPSSSKGGWAATEGESEQIQQVQKFTSDYNNQTTKPPDQTQPEVSLSERSVEVFHGGKIEGSEVNALTHLGTEAAAKKALGENASKQIYKGILTFNKPITLKDSGRAHTPVKLAEDLVSAGFNVPHFVSAIKATEAEEGVKAANEMIAKILLKRGYDVIVYENQNEDKGSTSYITLKPNQVKFEVNKINEITSLEQQLRPIAESLAISQGMSETEAKELFVDLKKEAGSDEAYLAKLRELAFTFQLDVATENRQPDGTTIRDLRMTSRGVKAEDVLGDKENRSGRIVQTTENRAKKKSLGKVKDAKTGKMKEIYEYLPEPKEEVDLGPDENGAWIINGWGVDGEPLESPRVIRAESAEAAKAKAEAQGMKVDTVRAKPRTVYSFPGGLFDEVVKRAPAATKAITGFLWKAEKKVQDALLSQLRTGLPADIVGLAKEYVPAHTTFLRNLSLNEATMMADSMDDIVREGQANANINILDMRKLYGDMNAADRIKTTLAMNRGKFETNAKIKEFNVKALAIYDRLLESAKAAGIRRKTKPESRMTKKQLESDTSKSWEALYAKHEKREATRKKFYDELKGSGKAFPETLNEHGQKMVNRAMTKGLSDPAILKAAEDMMVDTSVPPSLRPKSVEAALSKIINYGRRQMIAENGYFQKTRTQLPQSWIEWDPDKVLPKFFERQAMYLAAVNRWGPKFEFATLLNQRIAHKTGDATLMPRLENFIRMYFNPFGMVDKRSGRVAGALSQYQTATKLGLSLPSIIQNSTQRVGNTILLEPQSVLAAMKQFPPFLNVWMKSADALRDKILRSGSVSPLTELSIQEKGASKALDRISDIAMAPFGAVEEGNQITASLAAQIQMQRDFEKLAHITPAGRSFMAKAGDFLLSMSGVYEPIEAAQRRVERAHLSVEKLTKRVKSGKPLTKEELDKAAYYFNKDTQFTSTFASDRSWWRKSPWARLLLKFKPYGFRQVALIYDHVLKEFVKGNARPLTAFVVANIITGELNNTIKDLIYGKSRAEQSAGKRLANDFIFGSGALGLMGSLTFGLKDFIFGPMGSTTSNAVDATTSAIQRPELAGDALADFLAKDVVVARQAHSVLDQIDQAWFKDSDRLVRYNAARKVAFDWKQQRKSQGVVIDAYKSFVEGIPSYFPGPNTLAFKYAARSITMNDVERAAGYLETVFQPDEPIPEGVKKIKQSMEQWSPIGPVAQKDLGLFLKTLTPEKRKEIMTLESEWKADYNKALGMAVKAAAKKRFAEFKANRSEG